MRLNNGLIGYTTNKFNKFCRSTSIEHQLTKIYTLKQNGASERKNKTIMKMTKGLLFEAKLLKKFYVNVVNIFIYLLKKFPINALKGKLHLRHGMDKNLQCNILEFFVAYVTFIYLKLKSTS